MGVDLELLTGGSGARVVTYSFPKADASLTRGHLSAIVEYIRKQKGGFSQADAATLWISKHSAAYVSGPFNLKAKTSGFLTIGANDMAFMVYAGAFSLALRPVFKIPYVSVTGATVDTAERMTLTRAVALGIFAFGFKKKTKLLKLDFRDETGLNVTVVFGAEGLTDLDRLNGKILAHAPRSSGATSTEYIEWSRNATARRSSGGHRIRLPLRTAGCHPTAPEEDIGVSWKSWHPCEKRGFSPTTSSRRRRGIFCPGSKVGSFRFLHKMPQAWRTRRAPLEPAPKIPWRRYVHRASTSRVTPAPRYPVRPREPRSEYPLGKLIWSVGAVVCGVEVFMHILSLLPRGMAEKWPDAAQLAESVEIRRVYCWRLSTECQESRGNNFRERT